MQDKKSRNIQERTFEFAKRVVKLHQYLWVFSQSVKIQANPSRSTSYVLRTWDVGRGTLAYDSCLQRLSENSLFEQNKPDFISKCGIALKEARETLYWLRLLYSN